MAKKITELTELSSGDKADLLAIVDDPSGSPVTKKIQINNLVNPGIGSYYFSTSAATTCTVGSTWYKAAGTTTAIQERNFTHSASNDNKITYVGTPDIVATIMATVSMEADADIASMGLSLALNGTVIASSAARSTTRVGAASEYHVCSVVYHQAMVTNDYIELFVNASSAATDVTIEWGQVVINATWGT